jgi:hypothetical protein
VPLPCPAPLPPQPGTSLVRAAHVSPLHQSATRPKRAESTARLRPNTHLQSARCRRPWRREQPAPGVCPTGRRSGGGGGVRPARQPRNLRDFSAPALARRGRSAFTFAGSATVSFVAPVWFPAACLLKPVANLLSWALAHRGAHPDGALRGADLGPCPPCDVSGQPSPPQFPESPGRSGWKIWVRFWPFAFHRVRRSARRRACDGERPMRRFRSRACLALCGWRGCAAVPRAASPASPGRHRHPVRRVHPRARPRGYDAAKKVLGQARGPGGRGRHLGSPWPSCRANVQDRDCLDAPDAGQAGLAELREAVLDGPSSPNASAWCANGTTPGWTTEPSSRLAVSVDLCFYFPLLYVLPHLRAHSAPGLDAVTQLRRRAHQPGADVLRAARCRSGRHTPPLVLPVLRAIEPARARDAAAGAPARVFFRRVRLRHRHGRARPDPRHRRVRMAPLAKAASPPHRLEEAREVLSACRRRWPAHACTRLACGARPCRRRRPRRGPRRQPGRVRGGRASSRCGGCRRSE